MVPSKTCYELDYITKFKDIGLEDLIVERCDKNISFHNSSVYPLINYAVDFTQNQLNGFCKLILNSKKYN
jgi:Fe-S cluster assembly iron-binding protein IscA